MICGFGGSTTRPLIKCKYFFGTKSRNFCLIGKFCLPEKNKSFLIVFYLTLRGRIGNFRHYLSKTQYTKLDIICSNAKIPRLYREPKLFYH